MKKNALILLLLCVILPALPAQTSSSQFDMTGFPQWAKDLRRIEIITFGAFPFAYFFTNFGVDTYRCATHGWDTRYAPWPFDSAGSFDKTQKERFMTLGLSIGTAVTIALIDYGIVRYKRSLKEKESRDFPEGTPIIIRRPLFESEDELPGSGGNMEVSPQPVP